MYLSYDFKLDLDGKPDTGTGGGKNVQFDAAAEYQKFLGILEPIQKKNWTDYYTPRSQKFWENGFTGADLEKEKYQMFMRDYMKCVENIDYNVGQFLNFLQHPQPNINLDTTLIIFTSYDGMFLGEHGFYDKRFMYEPSITIPLIMRGPKVIPQAMQNTNITQMVTNLDIGATLLEIAGAEKPPDV